MESEGWRALAAYLAQVREARWARLSPEATAEECWPLFLKAVAAAQQELRQQELRQQDLRRRPSLPRAKAGEPVAEEPAPRLPDLPPA